MNNYQGARETLAALRAHVVRMAVVLIPAEGIPPAVDRFAPALQTAHELGRVNTKCLQLLFKE